MSLTLTKNEIKSSHLILSSQISRTVMGQFDVEAAGAVPILSGRRHVVRQLTDKHAATFESGKVNSRLQHQIAR